MKATIDASEVSIAFGSALIGVALGSRRAPPRRVSIAFGSALIGVLGEALLRASDAVSIAFGSALIGVETYGLFAETLWSQSPLVRL